jgi:hypothetical protein
MSKEHGKNKHVSKYVSKSIQEFWVHEQQMPTIVYGWANLIGGMVES